MLVLYFHLCTKTQCNQRRKNVPPLTELKITFSKVIALDNKKAINMHLILNILHRPKILCNPLLQTHTYLTFFFKAKLLVVIY